MARTEQAQPANMDPHISRRNGHQKPSPGPGPSHQPPVMSLPPSSQTSPHSRVDGASAKVHSYNSFKKIIEGKTFHPEDYSSSSKSSHSRDSSQASSSAANDYKTSKTPPGEHKLGVEVRQHQQQDRGTFSRPSFHHDYELKHAHRVRLKTGNDEHSPSYTSISPDSRKQYSPRNHHADEFNHYDLTLDKDFNLQRRRRSISNSPKTQTMPDLPQVHRGGNNRSSDGVHVFQFNPEHMIQYERSEPDGIESLQAIPSVSEQYHSIMHTKHTSERPPSARPAINEKRAKIRRQTGVHVKEDVPMFKEPKPRPKSDFIVRPNREEIKNRRGQGHVNSAYVEDRTDVGFLINSDDMRVTEKQRQDWDPKEYPNVTSWNFPGGYIPRGQPGSDLVPYKNHMKKTVNEVRKEREDLLEMRKLYARNKRNTPQNHGYHRDNNQRDSYLGQNISPERDINDPVEIQMHKDHKYNQNKHWQVKRKAQHCLVKSPRESVSITTIDYQDDQLDVPQIGLKKYVKSEDTDNPIKAAIMVHKTPIIISGDNPTDKASSPVVINVGEMTWERIKRQISKKNTYEVQKESKESLKGVQKILIPRKPRTHFTLSLFTLCFCLSPFGLLAMLFAVCSASAFKDKDILLGKRLSKVAFVLSIIGILSTIATAAILIGTNTIPVLGRYQDPEGNK